MRIAPLRVAPLRIAHVAAVDFTVFHFLLPLMLAQRGAGHAVEALCSPGPFVPRIEAAGVPVRPVAIPRRLRPGELVAAWRALRRLMAAGRYDMVHVHTPVAGVLGRLAARREGVPRIVATAHGLYAHEGMAWPRRLAFLAAEWVAGRASDALFSQSAEDAVLARRWGLAGRGPVVAIGNGADPARFLPDAAARVRVRAALDTPADAVVVLAVGRLVAEKGHAELLAAMRGVPAHLWIAGERLPSDHGGDVAAALQAASADPALAPRLRVLGYRQDVPDLLRAADVFALASHREGMPRSVAEAMLAGLPVVGTAIRGIRELVVDGETGLLVPPRRVAPLQAALARLAGDGALRGRMGGAGRARALALCDERKILARQLAILGLG